MIDLFNNKLPYNFRDIYILNSQLHSHATRRSNNIHKQFYRTNYGYYSIQCKGTNLWNSIPDDLRNTNSQYSIKKKVKSIFCHNRVKRMLSGVQDYKLKLIYS